MAVLLYDALPEANMSLRAAIACSCALLLTVPADCRQAVNQQPPQTSAAPATLPAPLPATDVNEVVRECQRTDSGKEGILVVWWLPVEFWILSTKQQGTSEEQAYKHFDAFRNYTVVAVAAGKMSGLGSINWSSPEQLRAAASIRDANGAEYPAVADTEIPGDAQLLIGVLKPVFTNLMGAMGKNLEILFFPGFDKKNQRIADPRAGGKFTLALKNINDQPERSFEWLLPLTSLSEPKFCPTGKEKVQANWKFCPWHGVPLDQPASPAAKPQSKN